MLITINIICMILFKRHTNIPKDKTGNYYNGFTVMMISLNKKKFEIKNNFLDDRIFSCDKNTLSIY